MKPLAPLRCGAAVVALLAACSPQRSHIFSAHRYDPTQDCLEPGAAIDVIEGTDPGACDRVRCWISPAGEIYITTSCDAPPDYEDHTADEAPSHCASALAANAAGEDGKCPE